MSSSATPPPLPAAPPPAPSSAPASALGAGPVPPAAVVPPAKAGTEAAWGPFRLRWKGHPISPEVSSAVVGALVVLVGVGGVLAYRAARPAELQPVQQTMPAQPSRDLGRAPGKPLGSPGAGQASLPQGRGLTAPDEAQAYPDVQPHGLPPVNPVNEVKLAEPVRPVGPSGAGRAPLTETRTSAGTSGGSTSGSGAVRPSASRAGGFGPSTPVTPAPTPSPAAPSIDSFDATPSAVTSGGTTVLRWNVAGNAFAVNLSGVGAVSARGERELRVDQTTSYILTATGPGGTTTRQQVVRATAPEPPVISFDASAAQVRLGEMATLRWRVSNATRVSLEPGFGAVEPAGSVTVKPLTATRYTLVAEGPGGTSAKPLNITVGGTSGPSSGQIVWTGIVSGTQLVTIDRDHADVGTVEGSLPGVPCILQPADERRISVASAPSPANNFERVVLRISGKGQVRAVVRWALQ